MKKLIFVLFPLILSACGSNPVSYLPSGTQPIVNIEANLAEQLEVNADSDRLSVRNLSQSTVNSVYKLYWYDINGVTQPSAEQWQSLWLEPQQQRSLPLTKPTEESANYRIYLRGNR